MTDVAPAAAAAPPQPPKPAGVAYTPAALAAVPNGLRELGCWVAWRYEWREGRAAGAGKWTKSPYQARAPRRYAKSTDGATWATFGEAVQAVAADPTLDGIGFVFAPDAGLVGVDLDHCRDAETGAVEPWAQAIVDELATYAEVSPSGTGVHLIAAGTLPAGGNRKGRVEMYAAGRFFTVTTRHIAGTPTDVRPADAALRAVHAAHVAPQPDAPTLALVADRAPPATPASRPTPAGARALTAEDCALLERALGARNSEKVRALYEGDISRHGGDASAADLALVSCLSCYTRDEAQLDRLVAASKLYRAKWDERSGATTYGVRTIRKALELRAQNDAVAGRPDVLAAAIGGAASAEPATPALPIAIRLLDAEDEPLPAWHVTNMLPKAETVLLAGPDGSMKSTIALHLAVSTAAGGMLFGQHACAEGGALILSGEDSLGIIQNRVRAIAKGHGWAWERVAGNLHVLALVDADLASAAWRAHLVAEVERLGVVLVILDPLADLASGEENDNSGRRAVVATWRAIAKAGATPVLVHHAGKPAADKSKKDRIRGASAIVSAARCIYFVEMTDAGVVVDNLKMSRAERQPVFVVTADIAAAPDNRAVWTSARFTRTTQRRAEMSAAETALLALITEQAGQSGSELQKAADVSRRALTDALGSLERAGRIYAEDGPRGARLWHLSDLSDLSGTGADTSRRDLSDLSPFRGQDRSDRSDAPAGDFSPPVLGFAPVEAGGPHGPWGDDAGDDAAYLADERAALEDRAA